MRRLAGLAYAAYARGHVPGPDLKGPWWTGLGACVRCDRAIRKASLAWKWLSETMGSSHSLRGEESTLTGMLLPALRAAIANVGSNRASDPHTPPLSVEQRHGTLRGRGS